MKWELLPPEPKGKTPSALSVLQPPKVKRDASKTAFRRIGAQMGLTALNQTARTLVDALVPKQADSPNIKLGYLRLGMTMAETSPAGKSLADWIEGKHRSIESEKKPAEALDPKAPSYYPKSSGLRSPSAHPCDRPGQRACDGSRCGGRAASVRPGGRKGRRRGRR